MFVGLQVLASIMAPSRDEGFDVRGIKELRNRRGRGAGQFVYKKLGAQMEKAHNLAQFHLLPLLPGGCNS
jgi:hypothetical protein